MHKSEILSRSTLSHLAIEVDSFLNKLKNAEVVSISYMQNTVVNKYFAIIHYKMVSQGSVASKSKFAY